MGWQRVRHNWVIEQQQGEFKQLSFQFSCSVMSYSLQPYELQHARPPCSSLTPRVHPNPCPLSQWCHPTISSSVVPFSSCPQSFPVSGSFPISLFQCFYTYAHRQQINTHMTLHNHPMYTHTLYLDTYTHTHTHTFLLYLLSLTGRHIWTLKTHPYPSGGLSCSFPIPHPFNWIHFYSHTNARFHNDQESCQLSGPECAWWILWTSL